MPRPGTDTAPGPGDDARADRRGPDRRGLSPASHPRASPRSREHVRQYDPGGRSRDHRDCPPTTIVSLARRYGASPAALHPGRHRALAPRQRRHDVPRRIACPPALTGAYAHPRGGAPALVHRAFGLDYAALERPDLRPTPAPRTDQHDPPGPRAHRAGQAAAGEGALRATTPIRPPSARTRSWCWRGLAREDLFTVVHEQQLDRHHGLRRPRAARDDLHGAPAISTSPTGISTCSSREPVIPPAESRAPTGRVTRARPGA